MNETHWCEDKDTLVEYLYDDLDADSRRVFEGHLRTCAPCALEVERLQSVRSELAAWAPPEMELGFTIVPTSTVQAKTATVLRPPRWSLSTMPGWARAAAAVFLVGAGIGFANLHVRSDANGLSVSTGWMRPATVSAPIETARTTAPTLASSETQAWRPELAALEADLRREMQAIRAGNVSVAPASAPSRAAAGDDQALLRRVQTLIAESERRQEQAFAKHFIQFSRESEMQRRADLVRLEQGFVGAEAQRGAQQVRQQQMLDYLYRVSTSKVP